MPEVGKEGSDLPFGKSNFLSAQELPKRPWFLS